MITKVSMALLGLLVLVTAGAAVWFMLHPEKAAEQPARPPTELAQGGSKPATPPPESVQAEKKAPQPPAKSEPAKAKPEAPPAEPKRPDPSPPKQAPREEPKRVPREEPKPPAELPGGDEVSELAKRAKEAAEKGRQAAAKRREEEERKRKEAEAAAAEAKRKQQEEAEVEAAQKPVAHGDVQVRVVKVAVGKVSLKTITGKAFSKDDVLMVKVELTNTHSAKKIAYLPWSRASRDGDYPTLKDNVGNRYFRVTFGLGTRAAGAAEPDSIYPMKSLTDVLLFEVPVAAATHLELELPADNFGGDGSVRFRIPTKLVTRDTE
jgi:hypothetical protein